MLMVAKHMGGVKSNFEFCTLYAITTIYSMTIIDDFAEENQLTARHIHTHLKVSLYISSILVFGIVINKFHKF